MIYLIISSVIDILLSTNITNEYQNINYFFPLILISSIPISYTLIKQKKLFFILLIILGILYDLLYSNVPLINLYYFLLVGLLINIYYANKKPTILNIFILSTISFLLYDTYIALTLILTNNINITIQDIIYKTTHSLLTNIIYITLSLIILKSRILGYKKSLNK